MARVMTAALVRNALRTYGRRVGDGHIDELHQLARLRHDVDDALAYAVGRLRARDHTWREIGDQLGISASAAQQRWGAGASP